jgi:hypothetical protein
MACPSRLSKGSARGQVFQWPFFGFNANDLVGARAGVESNFAISRLFLRTGIYNPNIDIRKVAVTPSAYFYIRIAFMTFVIVLSSSWVVSTKEEVQPKGGK